MKRRVRRSTGSSVPLSQRPIQSIQPCRGTNCGAEARGPKLRYCDACLEALLVDLVSIVKELGSSASKTYIGRTSFPERRLLEHFIASDRDHLVILHWADSRE